MKLSRKWVITAVVLAAVLLQVSIYHDFHHLAIRLRTVEPHFTEIDVVNPSSSDQDLDREVVVTWDNGDSHASSSGLPGFKATYPGGAEIDFVPQATTRPMVLHPGEGVAIGWIRLNSDPLLTAHLGDKP